MVDCFVWLWGFLHFRATGGSIMFSFFFGNRQNKAWKYLANEVLKDPGFNSQEKLEILLLKAIEKTTVSDILPFWLCNESGCKVIQMAVAEGHLRVHKRKQFLLSSCIDPPSLQELETIEIGAEVKVCTVHIFVFMLY